MMQKKKELTNYDRLQLFENRYPEIVKKYRTFINLTSSQKGKCWKEWTDYYKASYDSVAAENFRDMRDTILHHRTQEIKDRASWAHDLLEQGEFIAKPSSIDPFEINYMQDFITYRGLLTAWQQEVEEKKLLNKLDSNRGDEERIFS